MFDVVSANSTNAGSSETSTNLLNDRINLIAATTLLGVFYGIVATLYCMTTYFLFKELFRCNTRSHVDSPSRSRAKWRKTVFYIVYTSTLFVLATLYTASNSQNAIVAYVDNRLYPGGPYEYYIAYMADQTVMVMTDVTSTIILWMTDALILCRFIVFYYHVAYVRWIIPLACAMYLSVVVFSILVLQGEAGLGKIFYLSENLILIYYVLSFSLNVFTTVMIAVRLYWHKIQLERVFGSKVESPYMGIATMLIESAALYGAWSLVFLILCIQRSPGQTIILATMSQIQVIAPLLIILWIARGKAWSYGRSSEEDEDEAPNESPASLRFGTRGHAKPTGKFGVDDICLGVNHKASCDTVVGGRGAMRVDVNMIELGMYGSEPSSISDDPKA